MLGDALSLIEFLRKHWTECSVKSALFGHDCKRLEGDDDFIEVEKMPVENSSNQWFYRIKERPGYEFVYMPVIPSLSIDYGLLRGKANPDARFFRFVSHPMAKFTSGGEPNVIANFLVFGYKPKHLLSARAK